MRMIRFTLLVLAATCVLPGTAFGKDAPECGDTTVVDFFLPGSFKDAQKKAKKTNRCLLIKGVAFGMDQAGATCAIKGHW